MDFDFTKVGFYLLFLPAVILAFQIAGRGKQSRLSILLLSSYVFFILASGWHVFLLWVSTVVDYFAAKRVDRSSSPRGRKGWLTLSLVLNLGLLFVFKYLNLIIETLNFWTLELGIGLHIRGLNLLLPIGISFYTFQTISYTIDVYRGKYPPTDSFIEFACYAAFFPQLVAGPIVRYDQFRGQMDNNTGIQWSNVRFGTTLILLGLVKKFVFADSFAIHVNAIFSDEGAMENAILVYWATLLFGFQIYFDFSAYTDIAIGLGRVFGITLPENFRRPYLSRSPQEFWRRWHISLSTWLRDYLYIGLGGNRHGKIRLYIALSATMLLGGLWHGASWNFLLWGAFHGVLLIVHRIASPWLSKKELPAVPLAILSWTLTQWLVFMSWLIFRLEENTALIRGLKSYLLIDCNFDIQEAMSAMPGNNNLVMILLVIAIISHVTGVFTKTERTRDALVSLPSLRLGVIWGLMLAAILFLKPAETVQFIYFRF